MLYREQAVEPAAGASRHNCHIPQRRPGSRTQRASAGIWRPYPVEAVPSTSLLADASSVTLISCSLHCQHGRFHHPMGNGRPRSMESCKQVYEAVDDATTAASRTDCATDRRSWRAMRRGQHGSLRCLSFGILAAAQPALPCHGTSSTDHEGAWHPAVQSRQSHVATAHTALHPIWEGKGG